MAQATYQGGGSTAVGRTAGTRTGRRTYAETKPGWKTSEFWVMLAWVGAALIGAYANNTDSYSHQEGFLFASFAVAAYLLSRGLAKLGTYDINRDQGIDLNRE